MKRLWLAAVSIGLLFVTACGARPAPAPAPTGPYILPNAASEYCLAQGYQVQVLDQEGDPTGYCLFPDDTRCELWAFYEGDCAPTPAPA